MKPSLLFIILILVIYLGKVLRKTKLPKNTEK